MRCAACSHDNPPGARFCMACGGPVSGSGEERTMIIPKARKTGRRGEGYDQFIGQTLGGYKLIRKLGVGGMGAVFEAVQTKLNRHVALKMLTPQSFGDARAVLRFEREAQTLAQLDHPAVISVIDMFEAQGLRCIAMGFAAGGSFRDLMIDVGQLPEDQAADLVGQVALGLWAVAQKGIIHRDIKPGNLLLAERGQVKIADFGLVKSLQAEGITKTGMVIGTPAYMSPEQFTDVRQADHRSDLYSLGCVLYEMVSGRIPFDGPSVVAFLRQHLKKIPELSNLSISKQMFRVLERLLAKKPEHRYQNGQQVYDALLPLMGDGFGRQIGRRNQQQRMSRRVRHSPQPGMIDRNLPTIASRTPTPGRMQAELNPNANREAQTIRTPLPQGSWAEESGGHRAASQRADQFHDMPTMNVALNPREETRKLPPFQRQPGDPMPGGHPQQRPQQRTPTPGRPQQRGPARGRPQQRIPIRAPGLELPTIDMSPEQARQELAGAFEEPSFATPKSGGGGFLRFLLVLIVLGGLGGAGYFYREPLRFWLSGVDWQAVIASAEADAMAERAAYRNLSEGLEAPPPSLQRAELRLQEAQDFKLANTHDSALTAFMEAEDLFRMAQKDAQAQRDGVAPPPEQPPQDPTPVPGDSTPANSIPADSTEAG